jgi:hypothetical protein
MDTSEQKRERRIQALRQVVSLLRGKRDASPEARAGWATELDALADEEAADWRTYDSRVSYRNIKAYLKNEIGLNSSMVRQMLLDAAKPLIDEGIQQFVRAQISTAIGQLDKAKLSAQITASVHAITREIVADEVRRTVVDKIAVALK